TGVFAIPETVELTRHALSLGVTKVVMLPPFYYKGVSDDGVAEALKTPVILCWLISALIGASCLADPCSNRGLRVPIVIRLSRWSAKNFYIAALLSRRQ
ncbi:hypothetical protein ACC687_37700, partial [Rhizobium ruizarguesonis]